MDAVLRARRTVSAPVYLWVLRVLLLDIRGELRLESDAFRWRPVGWYGRWSARAPAFEVPLTAIGGIRLVRRRLLRSTLIFEDLRGGEIYADGNTVPIPLEVKARDADIALHSWGWAPAPPPSRSGAEIWRPAT